MLRNSIRAGMLAKGPSLWFTIAREGKSERDSRVPKAGFLRTTLSFTSEPTPRKFRLVGWPGAPIAIAGHMSDFEALVKKAFEPRFIDSHVLGSTNFFEQESQDGGVRAILANTAGSGNAHELYAFRDTVESYPEMV